jgi:hypothetical protein
MIKDFVTQDVTKDSEEEGQGSTRARRGRSSSRCRLIILNAERSSRSMPKGTSKANNNNQASNKGRNNM